MTMTEKDYIQISYKYDIINWLNCCKKHVKKTPVLYEAITQYINTIKYLTQQTEEPGMQKEIIDKMINTSDNIVAMFEIYNNFTLALENLMEKYLHTYLKKIAKTKKLKLGYSNDGFLSREWGFDFYKESWKYVHIRFENLCNASYGLILMDGKNEDDIDKSTLKELHSLGLSNKTWPFYKYMDKYRNWDKDVFKLFLTEDNDLFKTIYLYIEELLNIIEQYNL